MLLCKFSPIMKKLGFSPSRSWAFWDIVNSIYRKVSKFLDARKLCCNLPEIQTMEPNLGVFCQKDANGKVNSEDPDQTAPRGAV